MTDTDRPVDNAPATDERSVDDLQRALEESNRALEEAIRKSEEYLDLLRRARADFANYKRRTDEERQEQAQNVRAETLLKILPILDDFQRAIQSPPTDPSVRDWVQGVLLIERKLRAVLEAEGLQKIAAEGGQFNPWEHEAVGYQASPELEDGRILAVVRDGYRLGDRVIRPAQVIVARRAGFALDCGQTRKWRSGSASASQAEGRGFESRLPLLVLRLQAKPGAFAVVWPPRHGPGRPRRHTPQYARFAS